MVGLHIFKNSGPVFCLPGYILAFFIPQNVDAAFLVTQYCHMNSVRALIFRSQITCIQRQCAGSIRILRLLFRIKYNFDWQAARCFRNRIGVPRFFCRQLHGLFKAQGRCINGIRFCILCRGIEAEQTIGANWTVYIRVLGIIRTIPDLQCKGIVNVLHTTGNAV